MSRKQLGALFLMCVVMYFIGNAINPVWPIYTQRLGADKAASSAYLALVFVATAAGAMLSGWLSDRFQRRREFITFNALFGLVAVFLMGKVSDVRLLTLLMMGTYFTGAMSLSYAFVLTGLFSHPSQRGRNFGIVVMSGSVAQLMAGFTTGRIVDRWGYETLFTILALSELIVAAIAFFMLEDKRVERKASAAGKGGAIPLTAWALTFCSLLIFTLGAFVGFGVTVTMNDLKFAMTDITTATFVNGLLTLPLPFLVGTLSDRLGRRRLLAFVYVGPLLSTLLLAHASELWQFWMVLPLFGVASTANGLAQALINDVTPPDVLGRAIARYNTAQWIGYVIGYIFAGSVLQSVEVRTVFILGALMPATAILTVVLLARPGTPAQLQQPTT